MPQAIDPGQNPGMSRDDLANLASHETIISTNIANKGNGPMIFEKSILAILREFFTQFRGAGRRVRIP